MGCIQSEATCESPADLIVVNTGVSGLSYQQKVEKMPNYLNDNRVASPAARRRSRKKKLNNKERLTPSKWDTYDGDTDSLGGFNINSLDLAALTVTHQNHHWKFPKWRAHKKCTFCGCDCHSTVHPKGSSHHGTLRKQNNQRLHATDEGICAVFANKLAMVCFNYHLSVTLHTVTY